MKNIINFFCKFFLFLFSPLIISVLFLLVFLLSKHPFVYFNPHVARPLLINISVLTFFLPSTLFFLIINFIKNKNNSKIYQVVFDVINIIFYGITALFFIKNPALMLIPFHLKFFSLAIMLVFVFNLITLRLTKTSLHVASLIVLLFFIFHLMISVNLNLMLFFIITILLTGIIASILLFLDKYTVKQIFFSLINGVLSSLIVLIIYYVA